MQAARIIELEETLASTTKRLSDVKAQLAALQTKHASTEVGLKETESKAQKLIDENNSLITRLQTVQDELEEALTSSRAHYPKLPVEHNPANCRAAGSAGGFDCPG